jgi:hypothetical protein
VGAGDDRESPFAGARFADADASRSNSSSSTTVGMAAAPGAGMSAYFSSCHTTEPGAMGGGLSSLDTAHQDSIRNDQNHQHHHQQQKAGSGSGSCSSDVSCIVSARNTSHSVASLNSREVPPKAAVLAE